MKFLLSLVLIFGCYLSNSQVPPMPAELPPPPPPPSLKQLEADKKEMFKRNWIIPKNFATKKTNEHQKIKGTRVYIIPPKGTVFTTDVNGFKNDSIEFFVIEAPTDVDKQFGNFKESELTSKGYWIMNFDNKLKTNGNRTAYMRGSNGSNESIMFMMVDSSNVVVIAANYKISRDSSLAKEVKRVFESIYWANNETKNQFENATFEFDNQKKYTHFYDKNLMYIYWVNPIMTNKDSSTLMLMQAVTFDESVAKNDIERQLGTFIAQIESKGIKLDLKEYRFINIKSKLRAYEVICDSEVGSKKGINYFVCIEGKKNNYLFNFMYNGDYPQKPDEVINFYRKTLDTFYEK